jgi:hypothetical protein
MFQRICPQRGCFNEVRQLEACFDKILAFSVGSGSQVGYKAHEAS